MKDKPKETGREEGLTGDWNITFSQLQHNSLKIRQVRITTLRITLLEDYGNWKRLDLNIVNGLLANLNLHGEEFLNSAVIMKFYEKPEYWIGRMYKPSPLKVFKWDEN